MSLKEFNYATSIIIQTQGESKKRSKRSIGEKNRAYGTGKTLLICCYSVQHLMLQLQNIYFVHLQYYHSINMH